MLSESNLDIVLISTPPNTHRALIEAAFESKVHVIVEKPLAINLEDGIACIEASVRHQRALYLAYHAMFGDAVMEARRVIGERIKSGDAVTHFVSRSREDVRKYHGGADWIFNPAVGGGGALIDSGINALSMIVSVVGRLNPTYVLLETPEGYEVESRVHAELQSVEHGNTVSGEMNFDWLDLVNAEQSLFTFTFKSGVEIAVEFCSGVVTLRESPDSEPRPLVTKDRDNTVDQNAVPMASEYFNMIGDALDRLRAWPTNWPTTVQAIREHEDFHVFELTMQCYATAERKAI